MVVRLAPLEALPVAFEEIWGKLKSAPVGALLDSVVFDEVFTICQIDPMGSLERLQSRILEDQRPRLRSD